MNINIIYRALVSNKLLRAGIRLQAPCHNHTILGRRDQLLQVWVEDYLSDLVSMSLEISQQNGGTLL